jgi:hypothetical protein
MDEQEDIALCEQYLLHKMTDQERADFEQRLALEPSLAEQLAEHKIVLGVGKRLAQQHLTGQFAKWEAELTAQEQAQSVHNKALYQHWAFWALLALLGVIAYFAFRAQSQPATPQGPPQEQPAKKEAPLQFDTTSIQQNISPKPSEVVENKPKIKREQPIRQPKALSAQLLFAQNQIAAIIESEQDQYRHTRSQSTIITADQEVFDLIKNGAYQQALEKADKLQDPGLRLYYLGLASFQSADYPAAQQYFAAWKSQTTQTHKADWCTLLACMAQNRDCSDLREAIKRDSTNGYGEGLE